MMSGSVQHREGVSQDNCRNAQYRYTGKPKEDPLLYLC